MRKVDRRGKIGYKGKMARILRTGNNFYLELEVAFEQDGDYVVAYCPTLELSAYANTEAKAKKSFEEVLGIFLDDVTEKGTLEKVLLGLGWKLQQKPSFKYEPPQIRQRDKRAIKNWSTPMKRRIPAKAISMMSY